MPAAQSRASWPSVRKPPSVCLTGSWDIRAWFGDLCSLMTAGAGESLDPSTQPGEPFHLLLCCFSGPGRPEGLACDCCRSPVLGLGSTIGSTAYSLPSWSRSIICNFIVALTLLFSWGIWSQSYQGALIEQLLSWSVARQLSIRLQSHHSGGQAQLAVWSWAVCSASLSQSPHLHLHEGANLDFPECPRGLWVIYLAHTRCCLLKWLQQTQPSMSSRWSSCLPFANSGIDLFLLGAP